MGQVSVNGTLGAGQRHAWRTAMLSPSRSPSPSRTLRTPRVLTRGVAPEDVRLKVLYEDDYLLALDKPAGVVVHPAVQEHYGHRVERTHVAARDWPARQRPSIVGRLDKLTSGIVVVAKTAAAHAALQRAMAASDADKDYLAVVYGARERVH